jgi:hypothetical protein
MRLPERERLMRQRALGQERRQMLAREPLRVLREGLLLEPLALQEALPRPARLMQRPRKPQRLQPNTQPPMRPWRP